MKAGQEQAKEMDGIVEVNFQNITGIGKFQACLPLHFLIHILYFYMILKNVYLH